MDAHGDNDDRHHYIEFLQRQLLTPGWDAFFDPCLMLKWARQMANDSPSNDGVTPYSGTKSPVAHLENLIQDFKPATVFDSLQTQLIFAPILETVMLAANEINVHLRGSVQLVTSTDVTASPASRPSAGLHLLFIGLGTSSFSNYWAKAFTAVIKALAKDDPLRRFSTPEEVQSALRADPSGVVLAARLALAYGTYGSLIGFGEVNQPAEYLAYRLQLLQAFETFVVAHEFAHFVAEEQIPELRDVVDTESSHDLEYFCDHLALQLARHAANHQNNFLSFAGLGGILFFRAMQLSEVARTKFVALQTSSPKLARSSQRTTRVSAHPSLDERIQQIKALVPPLTPEDQRTEVVAFLFEYDLIASYLLNFIRDIFDTLESSEGRKSH
jgi:hypothetical protein